MSKHEIDIPELPEGWKPVAFRIGEPNETVIDCGEVLLLDGQTKFPCLIVEKIQPRRVTFEATNDYHEPEDKNAIHTQIFLDEAETAVKIVSNVRWKLVKEPDLSLPKDDDRLSFSMDECKTIYRWMDATGFKFHKIANFIKAKS